MLPAKTAPAPDDGAGLDRLAVQLAVGQALDLGDGEMAARCALTEGQLAELVQQHGAALTGQLTEPAVLSKALRRAASETALGLVGVVAKALRAEQLDLDDAIAALPKVHRIVEHHNEMELKQGAAAALPVFNFTIALDGVMVAEPVEVIEQHHADESAGKALPAPAQPVEVPGFIALIPEGTYNKEKERP
ncbi:MAG: hypothetical protein ACK4MG_02110 [Aquabacterium sp.]